MIFEYLYSNTLNSNAMILLEDLALYKYLIIYCRFVGSFQVT